MVQNYYGNFLETQLPGGEKAAVAGNDAGIGVHQNRVIESELSSAGGDLRHLRVGVGSRIPHVRNEFVERPVLDVLRHGL
jgi:hypothetical protein